jgi:hypothetical protein
LQPADWEEAGWKEEGWEWLRKQEEQLEWQPQEGQWREEKEKG